MKPSSLETCWEDNLLSPLASLIYFRASDLAKGFVATFPHEKDFVKLDIKDVLLKFTKHGRTFSMKKLGHLLIDFKVGKMEVSNPAIMPAMGAAVGNDDGTVSEANPAYMRCRAKSSAGLSS